MLQWHTFIVVSFSSSSLFHLLFNGIVWIRICKRKCIHEWMNVKRVFCGSVNSAVHIYEYVYMLLCSQQIHSPISVSYTMLYISLLQQIQPIICIISIWNFACTHCGSSASSTGDALSYNFILQSSVLLAKRLTGCLPVCRLFACLPGPPETWLTDCEGKV